MKTFAGNSRTRTFEAPSDATREDASAGRKTRRARARRRRRGRPPRQQRQRRQQRHRPASNQRRRADSTDAPAAVRPRWYFLRIQVRRGPVHARAGREKFEGRDVLRIQYYPTKLYGDDGRRRGRRGAPPRELTEKEQRQQADFRRLLNKVAVVTIWVEPRRIRSSSTPSTTSTSISCRCRG